MILPTAPEALALCLQERLARSPEMIGQDVAALPNGRAAAVLIGLVSRPAGLTILLTRRALHLPAHPGQISFPGGAMEVADADLVVTALRESEEEIGLQPACVTVLGALGGYHTVSGFCVTPVVGLVAPDARFMPDPAEVSELFELPATVLLNPAMYERRWVERGGARVKSHFLDCEGRLVWGATAGMLIGFARLLGAVGVPVERDDLIYRP